jgi:hypothetical protein
MGEYVEVWDEGEVSELYAVGGGSDQEGGGEEDVGGGGTQSVERVDDVELNMRISRLHNEVQYKVYHAYPSPLFCATTMNAQFNAHIKLLISGHVRCLLPRS